MRRKRGSLAVLLAAILPAAGVPARAEVRPLTLYQMTARAKLVAHVRAVSDSTRRPPLEVLEVYKGPDPGKRIRIVPHTQDNSNPKPWLRREVLREGEEYFLFMNPYDPDPDDDPFEPAPPEAEGKASGGLDPLYTVLNAHQGVLSIPAEGGGALSEALKRFSGILALREHDLQARAFRQLLREENPFLVEAALVEMDRFDLTTVKEMDPLLELLASRRPDFRAGSARLLAGLARSLRDQGRDLPRRDRIMGRIADLARDDPEVSVRLEAVRAIRHLGGDEAAPLLRAVGSSDEDQEVRYRAQVMLLELTGRIPPRRGGS